MRDGFVTSKDNAPAYWFYDTLWVILADVHQTGGSFSVLEQWMRTGVGPPLHVHNADEWFFVFSGSMNMQLGARMLVVTAGDSVWIPLELPNSDAFGRLRDNYWSSLRTPTLNQDHDQPQDVTPRPAARADSILEVTTNL